MADAGASVVVVVRSIGRAGTYVQCACMVHSYNRPGYPSNFVMSTMRRKLVAVAVTGDDLFLVVVLLWLVGGGGVIFVVVVVVVVAACSLRRTLYLARLTPF